MRLKNIIKDPSNRKERLYFLAMLVFFAGTAAGISSVVNSDKREAFYNFFISGGLAFRSGESTIFEILKMNFCGVFFILLFLFVLGFFTFGQVISIPVILYRGFSLGTSVTLMMYEFGSKGILLSSVLIIPFGIFTNIAILLAVRETIRGSDMLFKYIFFCREKENTKKFVKLYAIRFVVLISLLAVGMIIQGFLLYFSVKFII